MSFIDFESGTAKEKARQELREARAVLLAQAETQFNRRQEREAQRALRGDDDWMLPAVARKLDKSAAAAVSSSQPEKPKKHKSKKDKKSKKSKKARKSKKHDSETDSSSDASSDNDSKNKRKKRKHKHRSRKRSSSSSSGSGSESDEWVESDAKQTASFAKSKVVEKQTVAAPLQRDDWNAGFMIPTYSKPKEDKLKDQRKTLDSYDPAKSSRELNPFWKNGGGGLPSTSGGTASTSAAAQFKKPKVNSSDDDSDGGRSSDRHRKMQSSSRTPQTSSSRGNWRKPHQHQAEQLETRAPRSDSNSDSSSPPRSPDSERTSSKPAHKVQQNTLTTTSDTSDANPTHHSFLTDQQMNDLGAKVLRAEIMGNNELAEQLRGKLAEARVHRETHKSKLVAAAKASASNANTSRRDREDDESADNDVLLTATSSRGISKPLQQRQAATAPADPWGGRAGAKKSKKKVDTHADGERVRFFADDDKYDIKQMFENEKFSTGHDQERQFVDIAARHRNPNDDVEDIFAERAQRSGAASDAQLEANERAHAIQQHRELTKTLDSCTRCFGSSCMDKKLIVSMGAHVYLALPWHVGLLAGHCQIVSVAHSPCATQLDENVWSEVVLFQKAVTRMFRARGQDVIFFETASYLHRRPHMVIDCVPHKDFEMAPFYFKKAIQESEREWSTNKQLVTLRDKDLQRSIPKGLPYFWVQFSVDSGFAHVIEEQDRFPANFAHEIIGGMLQLDARMWRHKRKEHNPIARVQQVADWWKPFDCTED